MQTIKATWINGKIVPDGPVDSPYGCRLTIDAEPRPSFVGMTEDEQGSAAASIARWIAAFDAIPPVEMTPDEVVAWRRAQCAQREFDKAKFDDNVQNLTGIWE